MSPDEQQDDSEKTAIRPVPDPVPERYDRPTAVANEVVEPAAPAAVDPEPPRTWAPAGGESPAEAQRLGTEAASDPFNDRPHVWVAGAFVGGLVFAQILKRFGGGDD